MDTLVLIVKTALFIIPLMLADWRYPNPFSIPRGVVCAATCFLFLYYVIGIPLNFAVGAGILFGLGNYIGIKADFPQLRDPRIR